MEKELFLEKLTELTDTEMDLNMDTRLEDIEEWDSLSFVAFLAMCSTSFDKTLNPQDVKAAQTVGDLYALAGGCN